MLRKNGREQACEPCRKGKLRCDHMKPFCGRCSRRGMTSHCVYHPAPMTRPKFSSPRRAEQIISGTSSTAPSSVHHQIELNSARPESNLQLVEDRIGRSPVFKHGGAAGANSFSSIFTENESSFGLNILEVGMDDDKSTMGIDSPLRAQLQTREGFISRTLVSQGVAALRSLPTCQVCERLLEMLPAIMEVTMSHCMIRTCISAVFSRYRDQLNSPRCTEGLSHIVLDLCNNAKRSSPSDHPDS